MALLDMQGMEAARDSRADQGRSALSLLSQVCADSVLSVAVCE